MTGRITRTLLLALTFLVAVLQVSALGHDMRCGSRLVSTGNRKFEVLAKCGEPTYKTVRYEKRIRRDLYRDLFPPREQRESEKLREPLFVEEFVKLEEWTYNFGSLQFIRFLTFENGVLVNIETGDYGF